MKYVFKDGTSVDVEIIRKTNKNIYFRIKEDLKLYLSVPLYLSVKEIEKLISKNEDSLFEMYEKQEAISKDKDKFLYLGKKYYIVIDENESDIRFDNKNVFVSSEEKLNKFLENEISRVFNEEIEIAKNCFLELPDFRLRIRKMSTRWGVCDTRKKIITLNSELIKKDIELIDYVIIHEMCHFYEPNHSSNFWQLVGQAFPNYKEARKRLRSR